MKSPTFHYLVLATFNLDCPNGEVIRDHATLYGPFKGRHAHDAAEALAVKLQRQGAWTRILSAPEQADVAPAYLDSIAPPSNPGTVRGLRGRYDAA